MKKTTKKKTKELPPGQQKLTAFFTKQPDASSGGPAGNASDSAQAASVQAPTATISQSAPSRQQTLLGSPERQRTLLAASSQRAHEQTRPGAQPAPSNLRQRQPQAPEVQRATVTHFHIKREPLEDEELLSQPIVGSLSDWAQTQDKPTGRHRLVVSGIADVGDPELGLTRYQRFLGALAPPALDTCGHGAAEGAPDALALRPDGDSGGLQDPYTHGAEPGLMQTPGLTASSWPAAADAGPVGGRPQQWLPPVQAAAGPTSQPLPQPTSFQHIGTNPGPTHTSHPGQYGQPGPSWNQAQPSQPPAHNAWPPHLPPNGLGPSQLPAYKHGSQQCNPHNQGHSQAQQYRRSPSPCPGPSSAPYHHPGSHPHPNATQFPGMASMPSAPTGTPPAGQGGWSRPHGPTGDWGSAQQGRRPTPPAASTPGPIQSQPPGAPAQYGAPGSGWQSAAAVHRQEQGHPPRPHGPGGPAVGQQGWGRPAAHQSSQPGAGGGVNGPGPGGHMTPLNGQGWRPSALPNWRSQQHSQQLQQQGPSSGSAASTNVQGQFTGVGAAAQGWPATARTPPPGPLQQSGSVHAGANATTSHTNRQGDGRGAAGPHGSWARGQPLSQPNGPTQMTQQPGAPTQMYGPPGVATHAYGQPGAATQVYQPPPGAWNQARGGAGAAPTTYGGTATGTRGQGGREGAATATGTHTGPAAGPGPAAGGASTSAGAASARPAAGAEAAANARAPWSANLNDGQLQAVTGDAERPLLIVAGAGTGKTTTLIKRILYLVTIQGVRPDKLLVITFTNKAAAEVRERLQKAGVDPRGLVAATFHAWCFGILRYHYKAAGFAQCPTVWTDTDLKRAVALAMRLESLEKGAGDLRDWLRVGPSGSWREIFQAAEEKHKVIWDRCAEKARQLESAGQKKRKRKKDDADEDGDKKPAGKGRGAKNRRVAGGGNAPAASTTTAPGTATPPADTAATTTAAARPAASTTTTTTAAPPGKHPTGRGAPGPFSRTGDAPPASNQGHQPGPGLQQQQQQPGGDGGAQAAAAQGAGAAPGPAPAPGAGSEMEQRLLYRAEFLKLLYEELAKEYQPGVKTGLGAKPTGKQIKYELNWIDQFKRSGDQRIEDYPLKVELYKTYQRILRDANAVDFNDMLLMVYRMLTAPQNTILQRLRIRHQYVLVDEYQDCSMLQVGMVQLLEGGRGRITVVGDDAQSIYRFRGALPNVFKIFREWHQRDQMQQTLLELNYRSRPKILRVGDAVLKDQTGEDAAGVTAKVLRPTKDDTPDKVVFLQAGAPVDEAEAIAEEVARLHQEAGLGYEQVAVLLRCFKLGGAKTHSALQEAFRFRGIPFVLVRDKSVFERREVQDMLAYLRLAANPADDAAFHRIFNTPPRGLGDQKGKFFTRLTDMQEYLDRKRQDIASRGASSSANPAPDTPPSVRPVEDSLYALSCALLDPVGNGRQDVLEALEYTPDPTPLKPAQRKGVLSLLEVIETLRRDVWQLGPAGAVVRVLELTGYLAWWGKQKANRERQARDAAEELALSPGGAARAGREAAKKAVGAQESDLSSSDDEDNEVEEASAQAKQADNPPSTPRAKPVKRSEPAAAETPQRGQGRRKGGGGGEGGASSDEEGDDDDEDEQEEDEGEEGEGGAEELEPLPPGLAPEPVKLDRDAHKVLGLRTLFREAQLFASNWQVPGEGTFPWQHDEPQPKASAAATTPTKAPTGSQRTDPRVSSSAAAAAAAPGSVPRPGRSWSSAARPPPPQQRSSAGSSAAPPSSSDGAAPAAAAATPRRRGVPELFQIAARALMTSFSGEEVQAALRQVCPRTGLSRVVPHVLEQVYAEHRRGPLVLRDFLTHVSLSDREVASGGRDTTTAAAGPKRPAVTISTIHAAKGLEWPVVFVARWCQGYLPTMYRADQQVEERAKGGDPQALAELEQDMHEHGQEERRLAHVAVTRAMERLYLTSIRVHQVMGKCFLVNPSSITLPDDPALLERRRLPASQAEADMLRKVQDWGSPR